MKTSKINSAILLLILCISQASDAGPLRWILGDRKNTQRNNSDLEAAYSSSDKISLPSGIKVLHDISYGSDSKQRIDVYLPENSTKDAPVIFMVHGGAWYIGDKAMGRVVQNKAARWVPKGFIFISINYRMMPSTDPLHQAEDVAQALALAQAKAPSWGGDASKFIIMGHSAGAHLVDLLGANPQKAFSVGAKPWLGTISLDSGAVNLVKIMERQHHQLYDKAFGSDPDYWRAASPFHVLTSSATPVFLVCSTQRNDDSCSTAHEYANKTSSLGITAKVLEKDLTHREINETLGQPGVYTDAVETFMGSLDMTVRNMLKNH